MLDWFKVNYMLVFIAMKEHVSTCHLDNSGAQWHKGINYRTSGFDTQAVLVSRISSLLVLVCSWDLFDSKNNANIAEVRPIPNESPLYLSSSSPASFPDFPPSTSTSDWLAQRKSPDPASAHPADLAPEGWLKTERTNTRMYKKRNKKTQNTWRKRGESEVKLNKWFLRKDQ